MNSFLTDTGSIGHVPSTVKGFQQISGGIMKSVENPDRYEIKPVQEVIVFMQRYIDAFLDDVASRGKERSTIDSYSYKLRRFARWISARHYRTYDEAVFDYFKEMYQSDLSKNTVASVARSVKAFSNWMLARQVIAARPEISCATTETPPKAHDIYEVAAAMRLMNPETRFLCCFLLDSACRIGEARKLRYGDYSRNDQCFVVQGKRGKIRVIAIGPETEQELLRFSSIRSAQELIFPAATQTYRKRFYKACARAGVTRFCPHRLRHTAAFEWLHNEGSLRELQQLLGHATPVMSLHYSKCRDKKLVEKVRSMSLVSKLCKSIGPLFEWQEGM